MERRKFIKIAGSSIAITAASISVGKIYLVNKDKKRKPWNEGGSRYQDPKLRALSWAILAPNPHNRQPWLIEILNDETIKVFVDEKKLLKETDPFNRQIMIGMGCFLELLRMALLEEGYQPSFEFFPEGYKDEKNTIDSRPVAIVKIKPGGNKDLLFKEVLNRRSYKLPFEENESISNSIVNQLSTDLFYNERINISNNLNLIKGLKLISQQAMKIEMTTEKAYLESVNLMRIGNDQIEKNPDGIPLGGKLIGLLRFIGMVNKKTLADPKSYAFKSGLEMLMNSLGTASGYIWITSPTNNRIEQIKSGMAFLRTNLKVALLGLKMQPISQCLQE